MTSLYSALRRVSMMGLFVLAGCTATERAEEAELAQRALVGLTKSNLLACAGTPDRTSGGGDFEVLTYESRRLGTPVDTNTQVFTNSTRSSVVAGTTSGSRISARNPVTREIRSDYCEAAFTVIDGTVTDVRYRSPGGFRIAGFGTQHSGCADIVASCVGEIRDGIEE